MGKVNDHSKINHYKCSN